MGQLCQPARDDAVHPDDVGLDRTDPKATNSKSNNSNYYDIVIVGGGVAGGYALQEFYNLKQEYSQEIGNKSLLLICGENYYPYERPALTKGFLLKPNKVDLPMFNTCAAKGASHNKEWYETEAIKNNIFVKLSTNVTNIDYSSKTLNLTQINPNNTGENKANSEETLRFDKLLLATGTRATKFSDFNVAGSNNANNIYYIRNYSDAVQVRDEIFVANGRKNVVCVGGGYIGMETGAALLSVDNLDVNVTFTFPETNFMDISMFKTVKNTELAAYYTNIFKNKENVTFINGGGSDHFVTKFITDDSGNNANSVTAVVLKDGTVIKGDCFIVGIGARINDELFNNEEKLEYDRRLGLKVNANMETNIGGIYACGDIARFPCPFTSKLERFEHVRNARASAAHAIKNILNLNKSGDYEFIPQFYSRIFNCHWEFYGDLNDFDNVEIISDSDDIVKQRDSGEKKFMAIWSKKDENSNGVSNVLGVFFEAGQSDDKASMKRDLVMKIVKERKNIEIFGKWHSLNQDYSPKSMDLNNVDALMDHLATQM